MLLSPARIGVLLAPTTPLWTGTVVSYDASFTVTATTDSGALTDVGAGLAVAKDGYYVRIRDLDPVAVTFTLAENPLTWVPGESLAIYNARLPFPRYQRVLEDGTVYKDYDVAFTGDTAALPPLVLVHPGAIYCAVGEQVAVSATASRPTHVDAVSPNDYVDIVWAPGTDGSATPSGTHNETAVVSWSSAGFRYLAVTGSDAFGTAMTRYVPVWVGVDPLAGVTDCSLRWTEEQGWQASVEVQVAPSYLRQSPVAVVDLNTDEVLFLGFIWSASLRYNYERGTLSFEAYDGLRHLYSYPFILNSVSAAASWHELPALSVERALWFLLYWHSTVPQVCNVNVGDPGGRQIRGQEFAAGSLRTQIQTLLDAAFLVARGWRYGGITIGQRTLFRDRSTFYGLTAADLTSEGDLVEMIDVEYPLPSVSEVRLAGFYYSGAYTDPWEPIIVRGPTHPLNWGNVAELTGLAPTSAEEILRWASRYLALENLARRYRVRPLTALTPTSDHVADLPDGERIAVEEVSLDFDAEALAWRQEVSGRTWGSDVSVVEEPPPPPIVVPEPPPPPDIPPWEPPLPEEEEEWPTWLWVATQYGGIYETRNFTPPDDPTQPTWTAINEGLAYLESLALHVDLDNGWGYALLKNPADASDRTVYRRSLSGGSWSALLTHADAEAVAGVSLYRLYALDLDPTNHHVYLTAQTLGTSQWHVLRWDGSGWSLWCSSPVGSRPSGRVPARIFVRGSTIAVAGWGQYPSGGAWTGGVSLSTDAGATWLYHSAGAFYAEPNLSRVSLAQPQVLHYEHGARLGDDLFRVSEEGGSLVRVALLEHLALNFGVHWISDTYPAWQRVIRDGDLLETWDGWDNAVVLTAFNRDAYDKLVVLHEASTTRQDWMILGSRGSWIEGGYPHSIYALDQTNNPGVVVGKSGASPSASPYTDSIPYVHEGLIFDGIRVLA